MMDSFCVKPGIHSVIPSILGNGGNGGVDGRGNPGQVSAVGRATEKSAVSARFSFRYGLGGLWGKGVRGGGRRYGGLALDDGVLVEHGDGKDVEGGESTTMGESEGGSKSWVLKILHVRSLWKKDQSVNDQSKESDESNDDGDDDQEECDCCKVDDDDDNVKVDEDLFARLVRRVSLTDAKLFAQMSYLGNLAYSIPKIKPGNLLKKQGLRFVTSSMEKKELAAKADKEQVLDENQGAEINEKDVVEGDQKSTGYHISASAAYQIAASAAAYLHSHSKNLLTFKSSKSETGEDFHEDGSESDGGVSILNSEMASFMATTDSVTAVVAAKEEVKQAVADDLNSTLSSPCEWFICDDDQSGTRFFIIQGSESMASWQANLLFEPIEFEGLDVLVHRGIYEAAKGIYEQMLPEVHVHLKSRGRHATFRFTGHSLGGSLSLLVNLMLLVRGEVPRSSLLPVIMFGAPSIMCGGDNLLEKLGLPRTHVQAIMMHRDIVPRAFSCNYPSHVAKLLKAVNRNFRNHPCLNKQKMLYAPMGELLILQPDEKFSPHHHLLPSGSGLYVLSCPLSDTKDAEKQLLAAKMAFLNSPHPLEILSDRAAYGSDGTIHRDHDMKSYLRSVRNVIRQELNQIRKTNREHRRKIWWPLVTPRVINADGGVTVGRPVSISIGQDQFNFTGMLQTGKESLKRFSRLVTSQHMHLLVVLLFPARLLLLGAYSVISSH